MPLGWHSPGQAYGHSGRVFGLAFHPLSKQVLASASEDETVRVWRHNPGAATWEQTSYCRGHQAEVLRVSWSPDGSILASGSADHTVRLWQVGIEEQSSYLGHELAVLSGHPEEVYAVKFIHTSSHHTLQQQQQQQQQQHHSNVSATREAAARTEAAKTTSSGTGSPSTANANSNGIAHQQAASEQSRSSGTAHSTNPSSSPRCNMLVTASGESLFLWDLHTQQLIHKSAPLPMMQMSKLSLRNSSPPAANTHAVSAATAAVPTPGACNPAAWNPAAAALPAAAADGDDSNNPDVMPSYIFSVAGAEGTSWLAAACSDGMLRLWDAGSSSLKDIAAVKVHPSDMGSCCSFVPQQPWLLLCISKGGQLVLQDLRRLGIPLLQQQLGQGSVLDMAWTVQQFEGHHHEAAVAAELVLTVVGGDCCCRSYPFNNTALQAGQVQEPFVQTMPSSYQGALLTVAASADGSIIAAAGDAVPVDTLQVWPSPQQLQVLQQQQQQHLGMQPPPDMQQKQKQQISMVPKATGSQMGIQPLAAAVASSGASRTAATSVATAMPLRARGRTGPRRGRRAASTSLFSMADKDSAEGQLAVMQEAPLPATAAAAAPHSAGACLAATMPGRAPIFTWDAQ